MNMTQYNRGFVFLVDTQPKSRKRKRPPPSEKPLELDGCGLSPDLWCGILRDLIAAHPCDLKPGVLDLLLTNRGARELMRPRLVHGTGVTFPEIMREFADKSHIRSMTYESNGEMRVIHSRRGYSWVKSSKYLSLRRAGSGVAHLEKKGGGQLAGVGNAFCNNWLVFDDRGNMYINVPFDARQEHSIGKATLTRADWAVIASVNYIMPYGLRLDAVIDGYDITVRLTEAARVEHAKRRVVVEKTYPVEARKYRYMRFVHTVKLGVDCYAPRWRPPFAEV